MKQGLDTSAFTPVPKSDAAATEKEATTKPTQEAVSRVAQIAAVIKSEIKFIAGSLLLLGIVLIIAGASMQTTQPDSNTPTMLLACGGVALVVDFILLIVYFFCLKNKT